MFSVGTRLRCGLAYGKMHLDSENSLYVGQPIIDAYRLQQNQAWSGGALTVSAVDRLPKIAKSGKVVDWYVVQYQVPLKKGRFMNTFAIDWTVGIHPHDLQFLWSQENPEPTAKDWQEKPDICEKWLNTKVFHDKVCRTCDIKKENSN